MRTVPPTEPSLFHNSAPALSSYAEKNRVPPTLVSLFGPDEPDPATISLTITVPGSVPSLFHSSRPLTPSLPWK